MRQAVSGCRAAFHVAALYRFWARDPSAFYAINVDGTRNVLAAASEAGVERLVYTSTVGTLGLEHVSGSDSADERSFPDVRHLYGSYKRSKYVAEHEVLRGGLPKASRPRWCCRRSPSDPATGHRLRPGNSSSIF